MYALAGRVPVVPGLFAQIDLQLFIAAVGGPLKSILAERRIDVIQILGIPPLAERVARLGYPIVMRFPGPPAWFQARQLRRFSLQKTAAMFTHGDAVRHFRESLGIEVHEVPPGVDRSSFLPPASWEDRNRIRSGLGFTPDDFVLISVGRLIQGKGFEFLLEAVARHSRRFAPIKLVVAGDGPLRERYERLAQEHGIAQYVRFAGHLPKVAVAHHLRASDAFALFSEYENYSNAALEAMASGIPVVASRVGGFPLQVKDGVNGYLIEPGDHDALMSRIECLRRSPATRESLALGATEFATRFSWRECALRVEALYQHVLEGVN
jgi:glycosyltransferase involved in cell wall biosynthesis